MVPYIFSFYKGRTKPHAFTWLAWSLIGFMQFIAMHEVNAGAAAWVHLSASGIYMLIALAAFRWGDLERKTTDYVALGLCLVAGACVFYLENYLLTLLVALFADVLAYIPTVRKIWARPHQEASSAYWLGGLMYCFALLALDSYSFTSMVTPVSLLLISVGTALLIHWRGAFRKKHP